MTHTRTQLMMSLVSGLLLGIAVFHMLPHAVYSSDISIDTLARYLMLGLLTMFFLQRLFHFHHHEYDVESGMEHHEYSHAASCEHGVGREPDAVAKTDLGNAGLGVIIGLGIHSFMDGLALAFSIKADWMMHDLNHHAASGFAGLAAFGVFFAILLHKPLDALTLRMFLKEKGASTRRQLVVLLGYALICPAVVTLILLTSDVFSETGLAISPAIVSSVLAFSAGMFLCIALSDLLPEIHFHDHDRGKMALMLLLGVGLSLAIGMVESDHRHEAFDTRVFERHEHDHDH